MSLAFRLVSPLEARRQASDIFFVQRRNLSAMVEACRRQRPGRAANANGRIIDVSSWSPDRQVLAFVAAIGVDGGDLLLLRCEESASRTRSSKPNLRKRRQSSHRTGIGWRIRLMSQVRSIRVFSE